MSNSTGDNVDRRHDDSAAAGRPPGPALPGPVDRVMQDLEDVGLEPPFLEHFVHWWRKHGLRKAAFLALAITLPLWRYVWIPSTVSAGVETIAESYGAELEVDDWTSHWFNIAVTGEDVTLHARGPFTDQRLFRARVVELDWSLLRGLRNAGRRLASLFGGEPPPEEPVHVLRVNEATLHLERLLSGRGNWQDAIEGAVRAKDDAPPRLRFPSFEAEDLRVEWVEHLPGESGGGLVEQKTSSLFLEDVQLRIRDLVLPEDARENATGFTIEGRTADGRFSGSGEMNLSRFASGPPATNGGKTGPHAGSFSRAALWSPTFSLSLYLENVGAAAFARLVSDASLIPATGTMTGRINIGVASDGMMTCEIDLQLQNVRYAVNPRSSYVQARRSEVSQGVRDFVVNEHVTSRCAANWNEPDLRMAKAMQSEITSAAVHDAPAVVLGAAGYDQLRFVQGDDAAQKGYSTSMSKQIGQLIGGERGAEVANALLPNDEVTTNLMERGLKSVGRGIKKVFGRK